MTGEGYKPLTDESVAAITSSYFAQRAARSSAQDQPRVVLVGGQPGAGKSAGGELVRDELKGVVSENGQQSTVSKPALPLSCSHIATTIEPLKPSREMTMSTADTYVRARIDTSTKERAADALEAMGLSISDAIRLLMLRIADERRMPFDVKAPNATTRKAIAELEAGKGKRFASVDDLMADLHADD